MKQLLLILLLITQVRFRPIFGDVFPYRADATNRYLVNNLGRPVFLLGDSPHVVLGQLTLANMATYFANLQSAGFNAAWIDIFGDSYFFNGRSDWGLEDGTDPFTGTVSGVYDLTTPNETFFIRVDQMLALAKVYNICVFLNVYDTAGNLTAYTTNGTSRVQTLGTYLGNRYKNQKNIIWFMGNDFQTQDVQADIDLALALINAILAADPNHLMTTQLEYPISGSLDNSTTRPVTTLGGTYAYNLDYSYVRGQFENVNKTIPIYLQETWYPNHTFQGNGTTLPPSNLAMRKQAYWSTLSGALVGYLSGNDFTDGFNTNWQTAFTVGYAAYSAQLKIWKDFFSSIAWYQLVPDFGSSIISAGRGTYITGGDTDTNDYVTAAKDSLGSLLVAYCPKATTLTVVMTNMRGTVTARWFDPTDGSYTAIGTFANTGTHNFVTIGNNNAGSVDWILVLNA